MSDDDKTPESIVESIEAEYEEASKDETPAVEAAEEKPVEEVVEPAKEETPAEVEAEPAAEKETPAEEIIAPLEQWPESEKEAFNKLPEEVKAGLLGVRKSLEKNYQDKHREFSDGTKELADYRALVSPFDAQLKAANISPLQGMAQLVSAQQMLQSNPGAALTQLIRQYGNNPQVIQSLRQFIGQDQSGQGQAADQGRQGETDEYVDPQVQLLRDQIAEQSQQIGQVNQFLTNQAQQTQQTQTNSVQAEILAFQNATDDAGASLYPHFEKVKPMMGALIQTGQASDMKAAYDMAIYASPDIRSDLIAQSAAQTAKADDATRKETVKAAKASSRDVETERKPDELNGVKHESVADSVRASMN